jgi:hypothetical protein
VIWIVIPHTWPNLSEGDARISIFDSEQKARDFAARNATCGKYATVARVVRQFHPTYHEREVA